MPKPASTRPAYKMLTCIYLCRTLLFFAPYADFLLKNLKYLGRVRFDSVRTGQAAFAGRKGMGLCRFRCSAPFVSGAACRFSRSSSGGGTGSTVRTVRGEAPIRSFRSWPAEPPLCDRSLAVKKRTVLRTVAGRIKKVVPSWEIRINLCNFVIRGVVSFREGGSCGSFCFT